MNVPATRTDRDKTIDIAKTIAILGIVLGHVNRGIHNSAMGASDSALIEESLYLWHLSVFAYLTGIFVTRAIIRDGNGRYASTRIITFTYLYIVWSVLQGFARIAAGDNANRTVGISEIAIELVKPSSQLWFFAWLVVSVAFAVTCSPWTSVFRRRFTLGAAAVTGLGSWGWDGFYLGTTGWALIPFFIVGVVKGPGWTLALRRAHGSLLCAALVAAASTFVIALSSSPTMPTVHSADRTPSSIAWGVVGSVAGTVAVLVVSALLARLPRRAAYVLGYPGQHSLAIFLAHIIISGGTRVVLLKIGVESIPLLYLLITLAGVAGPLVLLSAARQSRFSYLFEAPAALTALTRSRSGQGGEV